MRGDDRERYAARLRHLCRLIKRDRLGFCPINGILVLLPVSAADPKNRTRRDRRGLPVGPDRSVRRLAACAARCW